MRSLRAIFFALIILITGSVRAESPRPLKTFLLSCAYGTGAGALVGVASLAFSEDPASKLNQVARGASLGLYVGIGLGLYYANQVAQQYDEMSQSGTSFTVVPLASNNQVHGLLGSLSWSY